MDKKMLRGIYKKKRDALSFDEIYRRSKVVCDKFFDTQEYKNAERIFTYINIKSEFAASIVAERAFSDGKEVFVPVMTGVPHEMVFVRIKELSELKENKRGILEPKLDFKKVLPSNEKTIIIVPALAFDKRGFRLGYGGGFYDKYLSENKSLKNIGLAFDFQIADELLCDENDVAVDMIITEKRRIFNGFE